MAALRHDQREMLTGAGGCCAICLQQDEQDRGVDELCVAQVNDERGSGREDRSKPVTQLVCGRKVMLTLQRDQPTAPRQVTDDNVAGTVRISHLNLPTRPTGREEAASRQRGTGIDPNDTKPTTWRGDSVLERSHRVHPRAEHMCLDVRSRV